MFQRSQTTLWNDVVTFHCNVFMFPEVLSTIAVINLQLRKLCFTHTRKCPHFFSYTLGKGRDLKECKVFTL